MVVPVTLIERTNLAARYTELVNIISLTNIACNASARNEKAVETIALIDIPYNRTGMDFHAVHTGAERYISADGACPSSRQKQCIVTIEVGKTAGRCAAVANECVIT